MSESVPPPSPERIGRALRDAMDELDLDPAYLPEVQRMFEQDRSEWRPCCGMLCTPCVLDLARAVDRARAELMAE